MLQLSVGESDGASPCPCSRPASVMADNGFHRLIFYKDTIQDIDEMFSTLRAASVIGDIGFQR